MHGEGRHGGGQQSFRRITAAEPGSEIVSFRGAGVRRPHFTFGGRMACSVLVAAQPPKLKSVRLTPVQIVFEVFLWHRRIMYKVSEFRRLYSGSAASVMMNSR